MANKPLYQKNLMSIWERSMKLNCLEISNAHFKLKAFCLMLLCYISVSVRGLAQPLKKELGLGHYTVVGAFCIQANCNRFSKSLNKNGYKASIGHFSNSDIYYVYLGHHQSKENSVQEVLRIRQTATFVDAWVKSITTDSVERLPNLNLPVVEEKILSENVPPEPLPEVSDNEEIRQYAKITLKNTEVFLSLFDATNNRVVDGEVAVVDPDKSKLLNEVRGNNYLYLPEPKNKSGVLTLICDVPGYRKIQHEINFKDPLTDTLKNYIELLGTTIIVNFELSRLQRGDIYTLYNVYFYNDAAIMLPESKYELQSLAQMLTENPSYKIRLHGHTNGNYHGKIVKSGSDDDLFSISDRSIKTVGSAKDLSYQRAEVIKKYLSSNGVNPLRIEIKAWGGKRPIFDKHSVNAKKNLRVEVEVLED